MIHLPLRLVCHPEPRRPVVAWFVPGNDPQAWLDEILRWEVPPEQMQLFMMPRSRADNAVAGLLVKLPAGVKMSRHPRGLAFGWFSEKLLLPIHAELQPPVLPAELKLPFEVSVFHPVSGLVGFEPAAALRVCDLIFQPPSCVENWNFARPGPVLPERLRGIDLIAPLSFQELFGEAGAEIGSEPIKKLPPAGDEPGGDKSDGLLRGMNRGLAAGLLFLAGLVPHTGTQRTWINDLEDWASRRMGKLSGDLDFLRHKELHRLMRMLDSDPEKGLRHAIPMGGLGHRGVAPPGARLGERSTDFNLGGLGGGGAADFWNIPGDLQRKLREKYLEMANREMKLGRFRRAAYIHAQLLGDLNSAAAVLKQGRHFREAARLYLDHLKQSREAAVCFREAGLYQEAIAIYEREKCFVELAQLYQALGQTGQADAAYRTAVQELLTRNDRIAAAKMLEIELRAPEEALGVLAAGWPDGQQAALCLRGQFDLLGRLGEHDRAGKLVQTLRRDLMIERRVARAAQVLADIHAHYPDQTVRHAAADTARVLVSRRLGAADKAEARDLVNSLASLAREDRLLSRDGVRFVAGIKDRPAPPSRPEMAGNRLKGPVLLKTFRLAAGVNWRMACSHGWFFWAAGYLPEGLVVVRGIWDGTTQQLVWELPELQSVAPAQRARIQMGIGTTNDESIFLHLHLAEPLRRLNFPAADLFFRKQCLVWSPAWLSNRTLAAVCAPGRVWILHAETHGLALSCHGSSGSQIGNFTVPELSIQSGSEWAETHLAVLRDLVVLAYGKEVFIYNESRRITALTCEHVITGLTPMPEALHPCLAITLQQGAVLWWNQGEDGRVEVIGHELERPVAAFTKKGSLVLLSAKSGRIFDVRRQGIAQTIEFEWPGPEPVAVVAGGEGGEFGVLAGDGSMRLFVIKE